MHDPDWLVELRPLRVADADTIALWGADPDFRAAAGWSDRPFEDRRAALLDRLQSPPPGCLRLGADAHDGLVGYVDLSRIPDACHELGYVIGPRERWGQGLGLAVARAGLRYGFDVLGLSTIWAEVADANTASVRILQRLGMTEVEQGGATVHAGMPSFHRRFRLDRRE